MGLVEVQAGITKGGLVRLEVKGVDNRGGEVVNKTRGAGHKVWSQEEESLFVFRFGKAETVGVHCMQIAKVFELLGGAVDDLKFS